MTGLAAAWKLSETGHSVRLLESAPRVGGSIRTEATGGWLVDAGANALREDSAEFRRALAELGLESERIEASAASGNRYVAFRGKLVAVPSGSSPQEFISTPILGMGAKMRIAAENAFRPRIRAEDVSVAEFVRDHFGSEVLERVAQPLVGGIWAGDPGRLSVRHAFPQAWEAERATGSVLRALSEGARRKKAEGNPPASVVSFRRGLQCLPDAMASRLPAGCAVLGAAVGSIKPGSGARWLVGWRCREGEQGGEFDRVVCAVPAGELARLEIGSGGQRPLSSLAAIEYPPVASVFAGFRRDQVEHPLDGFGALVPAVEKRSVLGIVFSSSLFPDRAPPGHVALTVLAGGALNPAVAGLPAGQLIQLVCEDLGVLLGARGKPAFVRHTAWPRAIPQYNLGYGLHLDAMAEFERAHPGILIGGSVRSGISIPDCVASGVSLAQRALAQRVS